MNRNTKEMKNGKRATRSPHYSQGLNFMGLVGIAAELVVRRNLTGKDYGLGIRQDDFVIDGDRGDFDSVTFQTLKKMIHCSNLSILIWILYFFKSQINLKIIDS